MMCPAGQKRLFVVPFGSPIGMIYKGIDMISRRKPAASSLVKTCVDMATKAVVGKTEACPPSEQQWNAIGRLAQTLLEKALSDDEFADSITNFGGLA